MEMSFNFLANPKLYFGKEKIFLLPKILRELGKNILLITTNSFTKSSIYTRLLEDFRKEKLKVSEFINYSEPSVENVDLIVKEFSKENINVVVSIGGGSPIDLGKAVSAMLPLKESVATYLEGVGNKKHPGIKVPFIAVPTTAGTGAEATKNAVISKVGTNGFKRSLRNDNFMPDIAIVDPELTKSCPLEVAFACGMDALTQLIESYVSTTSNVYTDALCEKAFSLFGYSFERLLKNNADENDLANLSFSAYISGITLTNAGLGAVHGFASVIGGYYPLPHGVVCAKLLPFVTEQTIEKLKSQNENSLFLKKYLVIANLLTGKNKTDPTSLVEYLKNLNSKVRLKNFSEYGINFKEYEKIASETSSKNNPITLTKEDLIEILEKSE
ncbi:MAG: iron-containing alcohol dehydrogenase [Brevinematia bacterium]